MIAETTVYPDAGAKVIFTVFDNQIELNGVYSITRLEGRLYINFIYYPFHLEVTETQITVMEAVAQKKQIYTTEVD